MINVLIAYATKHHATAEIATALYEVLRETNVFRIDVQPVDSIDQIDNYDAIILGSAIYNAQWRPSATAFLEVFEQQLSQRMVWLFSSGPIVEGSAGGFTSRDYLPKHVMQLADRIKPKSIALFAGRLELDHLTFIERMMVKSIAQPTGDFRDWDQIREWATDIALALIEADSTEKYLRVS
jgi:menaquinone-dependent protoporphyrinogen oxidase